MNGTILDMEDLIIGAEIAVNKAANVIEDVKDDYFSIEDTYLLHAYKPNAETKCGIVQDYIRETSQLISELYNCFRELHNEERFHSEITETWYWKMYRYLANNHGNITFSQYTGICHALGVPLSTFD